MSKHTNWFGKTPQFLARAALAGALAMPLAACDVEGILDIQDPDVLDPANLTDASALPAFRAAALGDASVAFDQQVLYSGLLGDEWISSGTFPTRVEVDIRRIEEDNATVQGVTRNLYQARTSAEEAARAYEKFGVTGDGYAESLNMAALTYNLFGENYCSGVPFSRLTDEGTFEYGGRETTQEIFQRALAATDKVLALSDAGATQTNLARVLRARALLNLGQYAEAATVASAVPDNFNYFFAHSENTGRENNSVFSFNVLQERWSVANNEGGEGLDYRSAYTAGDPRTPWRRSPANDVGFDRSTPQYDNMKYFGRAEFTHVASGIEARLIEAEAALHANRTDEFLSILNELRDDAPARLAMVIPDFARKFGTASELPDLEDPGTQRQRVQMLFRERAFWLWLTSHRLGDMRRLLRQPAYQALGFTESNVFPTGDYHKSTQGGVYGNDVNLPISVDERNNPELQGVPTGQSLCLDRNP